MKSESHGFTLIELMIVIAIIGILSTIALPSYQDRVIRAQVTEAFSLSEFAKKDVEDYYKAKRKLPENNAAAGLPAPEKIIGNYVVSLKVTQGGAINIMLGNRVNKNIDGKVITIRPAIVEGSPKVPIAWVPGNASVPKGMIVNGKNNTTVLIRHLPMNCRY